MSEGLERDLERENSDALWCQTGASDPFGGLASRLIVFLVWWRLFLLWCRNRIIHVSAGSNISCTVVLVFSWVLKFVDLFVGVEVCSFYRMA